MDPSAETTGQNTVIGNKTQAEETKGKNYNIFCPVEVSIFTIRTKS